MGVEVDTAFSLSTTPLLSVFSLPSGADSRERGERERQIERGEIKREREGDGETETWRGERETQREGRE